jgi:Mycothiol maleylpyruvate isomerase N-terminal domain
MPTAEYAARVRLLGDVYEATTADVTALDDEGFGRRTRTALWSVRELLFHLMCDAQRALIVFTTESSGPVDTDAVSYWSRWQPGGPSAEAHARYAAKAAAAYGRPSSLVAQWTETSRAAVRAARAHDGAAFVTTQGHVLSANDFVHTLAVEGVVHHLDLTLDVPSPGLPDDAYRLVVEVLTGLLDADLPAGWSLAEAVLKGTGRESLSAEDRGALGLEADRLPLFG